MQIDSSDTEESLYDFTLLGVGQEVSNSGEVFIAGISLSPVDSHVYRFDRDGTFDGQFHDQAVLSSIATDGTNLFVADFASPEIKRFAPDGSFIDIFVDTTGLFAGLSEAYRIEFDASGSLYVVSSGPGAYRFDATGTQTGSFSHANLSSPDGIDADAAGNVWVVNSGIDGNRLLKFSSTGIYLEANSIDTQVGTPGELVIDEVGALLYVSDQSDAINRIKQFDISTGSPLFVGSVATSGFSGVFGISFDASSGNLFAADVLSGDVAEITTFGSIVTTYSATTLAKAVDVVALPSLSSAALVLSVLEAETSATRTSSELMNATLAIDWPSIVSDEEETSIANEPVTAAVFALLSATADPFATATATEWGDLANRSNAPETPHSLWLADELLERVFG